MTVGDLIATLQTLPADEPVEWTTGQLEDHLPVIVAFGSQHRRPAHGSHRRLRRRAGRPQPGFAVHRRLADHNHRHGPRRRGRAHRPGPARRTPRHRRGVSHRAHRMFGDDFTTVEAAVVNVAVTSCVKDLSGFIDRIIQQYQPDASDAATTTATLKRRLHLSASLDGWWHLTGLLDPETGQRLQAALDVYADPTGPTGTRTPQMRRADAWPRSPTKPSPASTGPPGAARSSSGSPPSNGAPGWACTGPPGG